MQIKNYLLWFRVQGDLRIDEEREREREREREKEREINRKKGRVESEEKKRIFEISNENSDEGFAYRFKSKGEVEAFQRLFRPTDVHIASQ